MTGHVPVGDNRVLGVQHDVTLGVREQSPERMVAVVTCIPRDRDRPHE
jgi:hypothetical protein